MTKDSNTLIAHLLLLATQNKCPATWVNVKSHAISGSYFTVLNSWFYILLRISDEISCVPETGMKTDKATDASLVVLEKNTHFKLPQPQVHKKCASNCAYTVPWSRPGMRACDETLIYWMRLFHVFICPTMEKFKHSFWNLAVSVSLSRRSGVILLAFSKCNCTW